MPKDTRIWMTFPIDFPEHPKIRPLSDAAFRAFVEMNGYSRTQDLDGRIPVRVAKAKWKPRALKELESNHAERPTLTIDGDDYVIHNYGEHQQTRADREAKSATNSANGKLGGRPPKAKPVETQSVTASVSETEAKKRQSQSQESEIDLTDSAYLPESSPEGNARAGGPDQESAFIEARAAGIADLNAVRSTLAKVVPGDLSLRAAVELTRTICMRASGEVRDVDAYVATAARVTPDEIRWHYKRLDLGAQQ